MTTASATPVQLSPAASGNTGTYRGWFDQLLLTLGITPTPGAEAGLADVVHEEGANTYNNPFNIEWHPGQNTAWKGTGNFNSVGVQEYATPAAGLAATSTFLKDNPRYGNLLASLKSGNTTTVQQALVREYTWAPFHTASPAQEQAILARATGTATNLPTPAPGTGSAGSTSTTAGGVAAGQNASIQSWLFGNIGAELKNLVLQGLFIFAGLGIIAIGIYRASAPVRHKITATAESLAPLAAAA